MIHRRTRALLGAFLDNELEEKERQLVEDHLRACPACRQDLALLGKLDELARSISPPPKEAAYWETFPARVRAALDRAP
jgi:anti-sigma factor RsiW